MTELSRLQNMSTPPAYLKSLHDYMEGTINKLVTKAVKIVS